ncbi:MAG: hypothetical protein QME05_05595 [Candidatus Margulisbacteria bacterium]|nr:hypothetical protein [Candidatus Margulisiibacteriota bacterium]
MLRPSDAALSEADRAAKVAMRQVLPGIKEIQIAVPVVAVEVPTPAVTAMIHIPLPAMIDDASLSVKVAARVVTGGQMAALVRGGYQITGHNRERLEAAIADETMADMGTGYVSLLDGRKLVEELNRQNPGRKFRLPQSEAELLDIFRAIGDKIGANLWIWTEEETFSTSGVFVIRCLHSGGRDVSNPGRRYSGHVVLLVEDR